MSKNFTNGTKNVREHFFFQIEQKMLQKKQKSGSVSKLNRKWWKANRKGLQVPSSKIRIWFILDQAEMLHCIDGLSHETVDFFDKIMKQYAA